MFELSTIVVWCAFALGVIFGAVSQRTHFCTMGAVSDIVAMGSWHRMRMWLLAIAVAIIGANALQLSGAVDLSKSIYQTPNFIWLSNIVGGLLFGVGMSLGSGCGSRTLVRLGAGNLKSLVVFVFLGISAYMTLRGLFGVWRVDYLDPVAMQLSTNQDLPSLFNGKLGWGKKVWEVALTALIAGALLIFIFADRKFLKFDHLLGGIVIGLTIVGGWYVSGHIGYLAEDPNTLQESFVATNTGRAESLSYVAPMAYTLQLLMLWSDKSLFISFGIASAMGIIVGSFLYAIASKTFRWESFTGAGDMGAHMLGGILMGFGGITALGCTIGQGISGISTLAIGSILTLISIIIGCALTIKYRYWRIMREA